MSRLAIDGGKPQRKKWLGYGRQNIIPSDLDAVVKSFDSGFLTTGPALLEFEESIMKKTGAKFAVAVNNGTTALHAAVASLELKPGFEAITTPITFAATSNAVLFCGGRPRFSDIGDDLNLSPKALEAFVETHYRRRSGKMFHKKTAKPLELILPVHFAGMPADMKSFRALAKRWNCHIIEDACHALGGKLPEGKKGEDQGSCRFSDMTVFSFHPVKPVTTGEGGAIATNSDRLQRFLRRFRNHCISVEYQSRRKQKKPYFYEITGLGWNFRLPEMNAALGSNQMKRLDALIQKRNQIADCYDRQFADNPWFQLPPRAPKPGLHAWHIYVIRFRLENFRLKATETRDMIFRSMQAENIGVNLHYIPVYRHPHYRKNFPQSFHETPKAESYYDCAMTLPIFPDMSLKDLSDVAAALCKVCEKYQGRQ